MFRLKRPVNLKISYLIIVFLIILTLSLSTAAGGCKRGIEDNPDIEIDTGRPADEKLGNFIESIDIDQGRFIDLDQDDMEYLISISYRAVDDYFSGSNEPAEPMFLDKYNGINRKLYIGFRVNGHKKGSYSAREDNLAETVYIATMRTIEDKRYDGGITEDDLADLKIEIIIIGDEKILDSDYEKGIHGLRLEKGGNSATYYNTVAIEGDHGLEILLQKLCAKAGLDQDCYQGGTASIYYFPTLHFASTRFSEGISDFYRCSVSEFRPEMDIGKISSSMELAKGWMFLNLNRDGYFTYEYYPSEGVYSSNNNMIRQLMSSRWLAEEFRKTDILLQWQYLEKMHKDNLDFIFRNWYREDGELGYIYYNNKSKLGATAMGLRVLASSPLYKKYEDTAVKLANMILYLQNEDGSFRAWYIEPDYSFDEEMLLNFYSGEAILSLLELYEASGDEKYLDAAIRAQDFYIVEYADKMEENYYPAYVPWHSICLNKFYKMTGDKKYRDAIFKLNDELVKMQNQDGKPYIDYLGRFYDPDHPEYGTPHSASTAVYVEGLTYAYEIAELEGDTDRMYEYKKSIFLGAHSLMNLQFDGPDMYYLADPEKVDGAIRVSVSENRIRVDTTQHTIDAFIRILEIFE